jgi:single-strand DNA-binding protein
MVTRRSLSQLKKVIDMSYHLNRVQLIGNLGQDPEVFETKDGGRIVRFDVATSDGWTDEHSGERRERTEWHRVVIFDQQLGRLAETLLSKGAKVFLEGQIHTNKWKDQSGANRSTTQIALRPFNSRFILLERRKDPEPTNSAEIIPLSSHLAINQDLPDVSVIGF